MKQTKKMIHIAIHKPTGAEVPVIVKKVNKDNVIEDYSEYVEKRKGFNVEMLQKRWDKCKEDVVALLQQYQIPAYVRHSEVMKSKMPVDVAIFFEEYIYGLENKENLSHSKLKSKYFEKNSMDN